MEEQNKISIVIPTYNRVEKLERAILSLLESKIKPEEIIVVDDGSTDDTESMVKKYPEVKYLKQNHLGVATARNRGVTTSSNDLIFFTDSDCVVDKDCLFNLLNELKDDIAMVGCQVIGKTKGFWAKCHDHAHYSSYMLKKKTEMKFMCGSGFMVKKNLFDEVGGFNEKLKVAEDQDLGLRLETKGKLIYEPRAKVYHNHGRNTFKKFLMHPFVWAKLGSIEPYLIHRDKYRLNWLAPNSPWYYLLLSPVFSFVVTAKIIYKLFSSDFKVVICSPFIFLNKMTWCLGTFFYLKHENK